MSPGAKKFLVAVVGLFVLFLVITQPTQSAGMVKDMGNLLQDGADSLGTFIRSLFA